MSNAGYFRSMSYAEDKMLAAVMPRLAAREAQAPTPKAERLAAPLTATIEDRAKAA